MQYRGVPDPVPSKLSPPLHCYQAMERGPGGEVLPLAVAIISPHDAVRGIVVIGSGDASNNATGTLSRSFADPRAAWLRFVVRPRFWPFGDASYDASEAEESRRPAELRRALEELGTTFIKLGQILSTRPDLLPPAYIAELQKLQDAVPPVPTALIIERIEEQLRRPVGELFTSFDPVPLAAASIGQVHAVTLPGGIDAVVKVQRPGVRAQVALDLRIAAQIRAPDGGAPTISRSALVLTYRRLVDEFAWTLRNELDYLREAKNAEVFQRNFADNPNVRVPAICWEYTTTQIITMERMHGLRIDDVAAIEAAGYSPARIAEQSARIVLQEVFEDGFFHADLHPGNLFVLDTGVIGAIDFGMVGTIDEALRTNLLFLLARHCRTGRRPDRALPLPARRCWRHADEPCAPAPRHPAADGAVLWRDARRTGCDDAPQ